MSWLAKRRLRKIVESYASEGNKIIVSDPISARRIDTENRVRSDLTRSEYAELLTAKEEVWAEKAREARRKRDESL